MTRANGDQGLLDGPRGRMLCLELAKIRDPGVGEAAADLAYNADLAAGHATVMFGWNEQGEAFQTSDPIRQPRFSREQLVARVAQAAADAVASGIRAKDLLEALQRSVDHAAYWQPPRGEEILAVDPDMRVALTPIAEAVAGHPDTAWWRRARTAEQWAIEWDPNGDGAPFDPIGQPPADWTAETRAEEAEAHRTRPADPTALWGGSWWSLPWRTPASTGEMPDGTPVRLLLVEDAFGWERAVAIPVRGAGETLEIRDAADWVDLCRRFPLEVTASRRHEWYRVSGHTGIWVIPDWGRVAGQWDAVHLSIWAYLTLAGRALPVDAERATMVAGFGPDVTGWLTGAVREVAGPRVPWRPVPPTADRSQSWVRSE